MFELIKPLSLAVGRQQSWSGREKRVSLEVRPAWCGCREGGRRKRSEVLVLSSPSQRDGGVGEKGGFKKRRHLQCSYTRKDELGRKGCPSVDLYKK